MAAPGNTCAKLVTLVRLLILSSVLINVVSACARTHRKRVSLRKPFYMKKIFRRPGNCMPIELTPICSHLPYNVTFTPNILRNRDQHSAGLEAEMYSPLVKLECSPQTRAFVCSVFFPMCSASNTIVLPCRSVCESVRQGCQAVLMQFGFEWPPEFGCHMFPEKGDCFLGDMTEEDVANIKMAMRDTANKTVEMIAMETRNGGDRMKAGNKDNFNKTVVAMETKDSSDGNKPKGDVLEDLHPVSLKQDVNDDPDEDSIIFVINNEDKDASTMCIEGDYNCRDSTVRGYINGKTMCCMDGRQLAYESFCGVDGNLMNSCTCVYTKPPGPLNC